MRMLLPALVCAVIFAQCKDKSQSIDDNLSLIPYSEFKIDSANIKPGTPINILAYTGCRQAEKHTAYYPQFIVVNRTTGDTVRILTTLISVDDDSMGPLKVVYSPPSSFNGNKQVLDATFEARPEDEDMYLDIVADGPDSINTKTTAANAAIQRKIFVVVDKDVPIFSRPYKTAIGVLHFHQQPW